jgi:hypothetical protein
MATARRSAVAVVLKVMLPATPALKNLAHYPLALMGFGCIDAAFITWHLFAGLIAVGVSLFLVEARIADE